MVVPALVGRRMHPHILDDVGEWQSCKWGWRTGSDELCQSLVSPLSPSSKALTGNATQAPRSFPGLKAALIRGATLGARDQLT